MRDQALSASIQSRTTGRRGRMIPAGLADPRMKIEIEVTALETAASA